MCGAGSGGGGVRGMAEETPAGGEQHREQRGAADGLSRETGDQPHPAG